MYWKTVRAVRRATTQWTGWKADEERAQPTNERPSNYEREREREWERQREHEYEREHEREQQQEREQNRAESECGEPERRRAHETKTLLWGESGWWTRRDVNISAGYTRQRFYAAWRGHHVRLNPAYWRTGKGTLATNNHPSLQSAISAFSLSLYLFLSARLSQPPRTLSSPPHVYMQHSHTSVFMSDLLNSHTPSRLPWVHVCVLMHLCEYSDASTHRCNVPLVCWFGGRRDDQRRT